MKEKKIFPSSSVPHVTRYPLYLSRSLSSETRSPNPSKSVRSHLPLSICHHQHYTTSPSSSTRCQHTHHHSHLRQIFCGRRQRSMPACLITTIHDTVNQGLKPKLAGYKLKEFGSRARLERSFRVWVLGFWVFHWWFCFSSRNFSLGFVLFFLKILIRIVTTIFRLNFGFSFVHAFKINFRFQFRFLGI